MKRIKLKETELNTLIKTIIHESALLKEESSCPELGESCDGGDGTWCEYWQGGCYCSHIGYCKAPPWDFVTAGPMGGGPGDNNYQKSRALGEQTIQLRESDLIKLIHRVINEQQ